MIPVAYQVPAAILLVLTGVTACFSGYRFFRLVLALFGFFIGAFAASSAVGEDGTTWLLAVAVGGGIAGALLMVAAYFVGVAIVGAALGAMVANLAFPSDPGLPMLVLFAVVGAVASSYLERYVIIVGTAFGGAWTLLLGLVSLGSDAAAGANGLWVAYPLDFAPGWSWVQVVWVVLGLVGVGVQLGVTGGEKGRVGRRRKQ